MELQQLCTKKIPPRIREALSLALAYTRALMGILILCGIAWAIGLAVIYLFSFVN